MIETIRREFVHDLRCSIVMTFIQREREAFCNLVPFDRIVAATALSWPDVRRELLHLRAIGKVSLRAWEGGYGTRPVCTIAEGDALLGYVSVRDQ